MKFVNKVNCNINIRMYNCVMDNKLNTAIIFILFIVVAGLSLMLIQNQKTINKQKNVIALQQQKNIELESRIRELEAVTPQKILEQTGKLIKDKSLEIIQNKLQK